MLKLFLCRRGMFTPISLPLHLQALQPDQLPDQVPLHQQDEAGVENYPSDGQPAGEDEAEELRHEEREEDEKLEQEANMTEEERLRVEKCGLQSVLTSREER